jgi:hypothetical protein
LIDCFVEVHTHIQPGGDGTCDFVNFLAKKLARLTKKYGNVCTKNSYNIDFFEKIANIELRSKSPKKNDNSIDPVSVL